MACNGLWKVCSLFANTLRFSQNASVVPSRSVIYYSHKHGNRKSVRAAVERFYRLNWGGWIHAMPGRYKKMWRKSWDRRWYDRQFYLLNAERSWEMENLINPYIKKPKYFIDDPYEPYQKRHNLNFVPLGAKGGKVTHSYIKLLYEY